MGIISGRYPDILERRDNQWGIVRRVVISDWTRNHFDGPEWEHTTVVFIARKPEPRAAKFLNPS